MTHAAIAAAAPANQNEPALLLAIRITDPEVIHEIERRPQGAPGVRIVCECKADKGYTEPKALEEIALARKNREAEVGVFIVARESATEGFSPLRRVGMDLLVAWDTEDRATDVVLAGAISIARALVLQQHASFGRSEGDVRELEQSIRGIERLVTTVEGIAHEARLVVRHGAKIGKAAEALRERLGEEVERVKGRGPMHTDGKRIRRTELDPCIDAQPRGGDRGRHGE
jgi:hypothetical protein